jgi:hypothetical protein
VVETKQRFPFRIGFSPWPLVVAAIMFAGATYYLLNIYGCAHWHVMVASTSLKGQLGLLQKSVSADASSQSREETLRTINELDKRVDSIHSNGSKLVGMASFYVATGWLSFLLAVGCFFFRPRWSGFIALPFGILALFLSFMRM